MPPVCETTEPTVCQMNPPTYADVGPIFATWCTTCHDGRGGEWPLTQYNHI
ncbi:MAG: hypothetical protein JNK82_23635, partial [Myxococcaceae bacterium]|nr:hypothetical protein [Myxococcaceae bacterium]